MEWSRYFALATEDVFAGGDILNSVSEVAATIKTRCNHLKAGCSEVIFCLDLTEMSCRCEGLTE